MMQDQLSTTEPTRKKSYSSDDLNRMHSDAKTADREAHAEMRSSILLIAGDHYSKRMNEWWNRSRNSSTSSETYKLRITKNWLHRAHRIYVSSITSQSPGTAISPRNELELKDRKDAELNQSVWEYLKDKYKLKSLYRELCSDFVGIGEAAVVLKFDPERGYLKGYEAQVDETGQPVIDEMGQPMPDMERPVFSGEFVFERTFAQNIFRDPSCRQMKNARWIGVEKMESSKDLKKKYAQDPDKLRMIDESSEEFIVFDSNKAGYSKEKDQTLLLEFYFKPCVEYPKGYYFIKTKAGVLAEGELPQGIFPVVWWGFDEQPTKPRATGIVKVARPWQAEINRASSQVAMHQVTISEDKILYQAGTKVAQGALLPGVRGLTYQGAPPTILPGRSGEQYFEYIGTQEQEMNRALLLDFLNEDKTANLDPFSLLFRSMGQSQKFSIYSEKFGEGIVEMTEKALEMAKFYLPDDEVIAAVGRSEAINMQEFRDTTPLCHRIHVEEQNDTIESKLGKQLSLNHIMQYVGTQLNRDDIGKMIAEMPFGNWKESFSDFTLDYKNVQNDFLAIERGQTPPMSTRDNSDYILKQVAKRKKERDFQMLDPGVQQLYDAYEQFHEAKVMKEGQALKAAESEFIPTGGAMIAADMYVPAEDPTKAPKRVRVPYQALEWLLKLLEQQGMGMDKMEQMNQAQFAEVAQRLLGGQGVPQGGSALNGQASPEGMVQ